MDYCIPSSDVASRRHPPRSPRPNYLVVRRHSLRRREFAVAGQTAWNSLSNHLRDPDAYHWQFQTSA